MSTHALSEIQWSAPWLKAWRYVGEACAQRVLAGQPQHAALNAVAHTLCLHAGDVPVRFVPQQALPPGMAYEQYIFDSGQCPTREGLHDFFNALAWLNFPLTKRKLNQLHVAQIARAGIAPVRGPTRDGLTLFDENAALLRAPDALWNALAAKDWQQVFGSLRPLWDDAYLVLFGHALLEKLVCPRKSATAHVYRAHPALDSVASLDTWLATDMSADKLAAKPFVHLPVLGVPHWWLGNEVPGFYDDPTVFRPLAQRHF